MAKAKKFKPLISVMQKIEKTPKGLKRMLADPGNWTDFAKLVRGAIEGLDLPSEPKVTVIGVPLLGGGAEASLFFEVSNFDAVWDNQ